MRKILISLLLLLILIVIGEWIFEKIYPFPKKIQFGITFSPKFAQDLQLDWQLTFQKILDELNVKNIRIPTYWDVIEKEEGKDDFSETDFILDHANKKGAKVILVLGERQPRWPECHVPAWVKNLSLNSHQEKIKEFITRVVKQYKDHPEIWAWQVENEPLLPFFGRCNNPDEKFLREEIELVRRLSDKLIIVSDSGELGLWITPMQVSDIFGTTLYRKVYNPVLGYTTYPILPYLYNLKSALISRIFAPKNQKTIIVELQAEPWSPINSLAKTPIDQQLSAFSISNFKDIISYAKNTGFDENYLWGVEWWYYMAEHGHPEYLEYAKTLFR